MRDRLKMVNGDCLDVLKDIESDSIDCILTDPPYKYLKKQKLDRDFDEAVFFPECKRVLKKDGFVVLFGRGSSFYRWNMRLGDLGLTFKEEIIWNKSHSSSPLMAISRIHETVSLHTKGDGTLNKIKVPYVEMKGHDIAAIVTDIKRLKVVLNNTKSLDAVLMFLESGVREFQPMAIKNSVQVEGHVKDFDRCVKAISAIERGMSEKSVIYVGEKPNNHHTTIQPSKVMSMDRSAAVVQAVTEGMMEKSIIHQPREANRAIHPTEKPVRLLERLLALVTKKDDVVLDPFAGSFSTGIACLNTGRNFIGVEIDPEYYKAGSQRLNAHQIRCAGLFDEL